MARKLAHEARDPRAAGNVNRRSVLVAAGAAGASGWAVTAVASEPDGPSHPDRQGGYRETEHVRTAYRLARF